MELSRAPRVEEPPASLAVELSASDVDVAPLDVLAARATSRTVEPTRPEPLRRAVDVLAATLLLVATSPLLLFGGAWVLLASGRPVFFGHRRVGRAGKPFLCWKLRTMRVDAEQVLRARPELLLLHRENGFKLPASADPRIIPGGRWLRRTYLDELPQLFNLLKGDMTLVGPRPVVEQELHLFGDDVDLLLSTWPGLFGEWTSRGPERPPYPERARLEVDWIRSHGVARNLRILFRAILAVMRGQKEE